MRSSFLLGAIEYEDRGDNWGPSIRRYSKDTLRCRIPLWMNESTVECVDNLGQFVTREHHGAAPDLVGLRVCLESQFRCDPDIRSSTPNRPE
ncbi:hypothetical protein N7516_004246 [Penicillium verrucosum]|uniref:uncharacterized protein n=1 Tax=Penicillium verrucosum TaxID=60171 RepID=UPI0025456043|nr:uncharacterized protein N7516_004246 [Penicillium verrucosum]KAJ5944078.1 hypothetical protein N7516_004246 [Penicillium verrucosum]